MIKITDKTKQKTIRSSREGPDQRSYLPTNLLNIKTKEGADGPG